MEYSGRVQIRDLWVDLKEFQLREVALDIAAGEYFVVLGPTGAGKTVLLETIAGLFSPRSGRVLIDGEDVTRVPPERRGIGFVYQDYMLFPHLNVAENISFGLSLMGLRDVVRRRLRKDDVERRVQEISHMLGIDHLLHRRPRALSGGERQRVALARALVVEPRLLLLDEPLSALDPETRESLERELARLHQEMGTTTVHVTHDLEEAVALGDRIAIVDKGRIAQVGTSEDVFRRPASEFVALFVGARNVFAGAITHSVREDSKTFSVAAPTGSGRSQLVMTVLTELAGEARASIRPEDIVLSLEPPRPSAQNQFRARIVDIADRGTLIYVTVGMPLEVTCVVTRRSAEEMMLTVDKEVHIAFKPSAVHVF